MKRIILLLGLVLFLTGCSGEYEIDFGKEIKEQIILTYDGNLYQIVDKIEGDSVYAEQELIQSNIPSVKDFSSYYDKKIDVNDNKTKITLNYTYSYESFENSYLIDHCFEKSTFIDDKDYYYVSLGGIFDCFGAQELTLKMKSDYEVIKENADKTKDGYYIWNIKNENSDKKVELQVSKTLLSKKDNGFKISFKVICWILLFIVLGIFILIKRRLENNNDI